jgi:hypothetical protein
VAALALTAVTGASASAPPLPSAAAGAGAGGAGAPGSPPSSQPSLSKSFFSGIMALGGGSSAGGAVGRASAGKGSAGNWHWGKAVAANFDHMAHAAAGGLAGAMVADKPGGAPFLSAAVALDLSRAACRAASLLLAASSVSDYYTSGGGSERQAGATPEELPMSVRLGNDGVVELVVACLGASRQLSARRGGGGIGINVGLGGPAPDDRSWEAGCLEDAAHWGTCVVALLVDRDETNCRRLCFAQRAGDALQHALAAAQGALAEAPGRPEPAACAHNVLQALLGMAADKVGRLRLLGEDAAAARALCHTLVRLTQQLAVAAVEAEAAARASPGASRALRAEALLLARLQLLLPVALLASTATTLARRGIIWRGTRYALADLRARMVR